MTAPLKIPAPARIPRDMSKLGPELSVPQLPLSHDESDDATLLWKATGRSGAARGNGFSARAATPYAFQAEDRDEDATFIAKPDLSDPRLRRSDRPRALLDVARSMAAPAAPAPTGEPRAPTGEPRAPSAEPRAPTAESSESAREGHTQSAVVLSPSLSAPSDWDATPRSLVPTLRPPRARPPVALMVAAALLAAAAAALIASNPEQSAVFVEHLYARGAALVASIR